VRLIQFCFNPLDGVLVPLSVGLLMHLRLVLPLVWFGVFCLCWSDASPGSKEEVMELN
jgi:hypothetical protein